MIVLGPVQSFFNMLQLLMTFKVSLFNLTRKAHRQRTQRTEIDELKDVKRL